MKDEPMSNSRLFLVWLLFLFIFFGPLFIERNPDCEPEYSNMGDGC